MKPPIQIDNMNDIKIINDNIQTVIANKGTLGVASLRERDPALHILDEYAHFPITNPNNYAKIGFPKKSEHDYSKDYLTFKMLQDARIGFVDEEGGTISHFDTSPIKYRINNGEWIDYSVIDAHKGDIVQFKTNVDYLFQEYAGLGFACNSSHEGPTVDISGNIMSLVDAENFASMKAFPEITGHSEPNLWGFYNMFTFAYPRSAKNLILPALNMNGASYVAMFSGCSNLIEAPTLPATTLTNECYSEMFANCTNLTKAPELPATTLAESCYDSMFNGCTSLTTAPELPATTLADACYNNMFAGCTSLTQAPELLATTLASYCYYEMFYGCTSLNYVKCLAKENITGTNTDSWLLNVSETGTFVEDPAAAWQRGASGIPEGWTANTIIDTSNDVTK